MSTYWIWNYEPCFYDVLNLLIDKWSPFSVCLLSFVWILWDEYVSICLFLCVSRMLNMDCVVSHLYFGVSYLCLLFSVFWKSNINIDFKYAILSRFVHYMNLNTLNVPTFDNDVVVMNVYKSDEHVRQSARNVQGLHFGVTRVFMCLFQVWDVVQRKEWWVETEICWVSLSIKVTAVYYIFNYIFLRLLTIPVS